MINVAIPISAGDPSQVGQARRRAASLAASMDFDSVRTGELSIVVTEAARNIALHAGEGMLILSPWSVGSGHGARWGVDVFALDRGPGIADVDQATEDGFSTAGTAGEGLGAIARLSSTQQIYTVQDAMLPGHLRQSSNLLSGSAPSSGTVLFARVLRDLAPRQSEPTDSINQLTGRLTEKVPFGAISIPLAGEQVCGDAWSSVQDPERGLFIIADGLGHGPLASEAAVEAIRIFKQCSLSTPERILKEIHGALKKTRGAAVSIAEILPNEGVLNYAGAGNVAAAIYHGGRTRSMVSMNGTVGHSVAKFQQFSYPWEPNSLLFMHSDGLSSRWNIDQYTGLSGRHPALIAAVLYRDFARVRDDATILAVRK